MDFLAIGRFSAVVKTRLPQFAAIISLLTMMIICGCTQVEINGRIVSYDSVRVEKHKLRYIVRRLSGDITQEGLTPVLAGGYFVTKIKPESELPYYFIVEGLENIPGASVTENSLEIRDNHLSKFDMREVYIYNKITKSSNIVGPLAVEDIFLEWTSDIPSIDYYKIKLIGRANNMEHFASAISVSGIKENRFAFSSISEVLRTEGTHKIGDLVVINQNTELEGAYFLDIVAIRKIEEGIAEVGRSDSEMVMIIRDGKI